MTRLLLSSPALWRLRPEPDEPDLDAAEVPDVEQEPEEGER